MQFLLILKLSPTQVDYFKIQRTNTPSSLSFPNQIKTFHFETLLVARWLGLGIFTAKGLGSISSQGTKIQATTTTNILHFAERKLISLDPPACFISILVFLFLFSLSSTPLSNSASLCVSMRVVRVSVSPSLLSPPPSLSLRASL